MDEFGMTLALQSTPQTVFSMLGALVGSLITADVKRYGWRLTILFTIVASVSGGAMSEYLVYEKNIVQIWVLFALNVKSHTIHHQMQSNGSELKWIVPLKLSSIAVKDVIIAGEWDIVDVWAYMSLC